jgi:hypothetical protein
MRAGAAGVTADQYTNLYATIMLSYSLTIPILNEST